MEQKLGACCVSGYVASGIPAGEIVTMGGVETYITKPKDGASYNGRAIIIATDVFGLGLVNNKLLADTYAQQGNFLVVVPDVFGGKPLPPWVMDKFVELSGKGKQAETAIGRVWQKMRNVGGIVPHVMPFMLSNKETKKIPIFENIIEELKAQHEVTKIGMAGFCYGGFFCFHFAQLEDKIDAFVTAHTKLKAATVATLKQPGFCICADNDFALPKKERLRAEEVAKKRPDADNFKFKFYPDTYHGFTVRGDESNPTIEKAKGEAAKDAVEWFQSHLQ